MEQKHKTSGTELRDHSYATAVYQKYLHINKSSRMSLHYN